MISQHVDAGCLSSKNSSHTSCRSSFVRMLLSKSFLAVDLPQTYHHYAIFCDCPGSIFAQNVGHIDHKPLGSQFKCVSGFKEILHEASHGLLSNAEYVSPDQGIHRDLEQRNEAP